MIDKKLFRGASIQRWIVIVYERPQRFSENAANDMVKGLRAAATGMGTFFTLPLLLISLSASFIFPDLPRSTFFGLILPHHGSVYFIHSDCFFIGITGFNAEPKIAWENPQADVIGVRVFFPYFPPITINNSYF